MVKHNNQLVNNHYRKDWDKRVRTWFNQPARKQRRKEARKEKARAVYPRPVGGNLRPLVHATTTRYSAKVRAGRGFSLGELKEAGISSRHALGLGISVDLRRKDRNRETLTSNAQRLKLYQSKQVVFPRHTRTKQPKGTKKVAKKAQEPVVQQTETFPFKVVQSRDKARKITPEMEKASAWKTYRTARARVNKVGAVAKKAAAAAAAPAADK